MIWAWIETSSAETGSSPTISLRVQRQRPSDADALALAAGEFVRVGLHQCRPQPDAGEQGGDAVITLIGWAGAVDCQWFADDVACRHARIE